MRASRHPRSAAARVAVFALVAIAAVGACGGSSGPTAAPSAKTAAETPSETPAASDGASTTPGPATAEPATPEPTEPAGTDAPPTARPGSDAPSGPPSSASECSGSDDNRDFFADAAAALDWSVYCGVLPRGWFVQTGEYHLRDGGSLALTYKGPAGAKLELQEGHLCSATGGCVLHGDGTPAGDASFGDRSGSLLALDDGSWAVVVDPDGPVVWLAVGTGIDQEEFQSLAADLVAVRD